MSRPVTIARSIAWVQQGKDVVGNYPPATFRITPVDGAPGFLLQSGSYNLGTFPSADHARTAAQDHADVAVLNSMSLVMVNALNDRLSIMATIAPEPYAHASRLVLDYLAAHGDGNN